MESSSGLFSGSLLTQFTIWLLALLQFILALYVFVINAWQRLTNQALAVPAAADNEERIQ